MKVYYCSECRRTLFSGENDEAVWIKLSRTEQLALDLITKSNCLLILVGGYEEFETICWECKIKIQN